MSNFGNIINGLRKTCKSQVKKILASDLNPTDFVTREEYDILKDLVLEIKSDIQNLKKNIDGKNN
jgi:BMFP domain-containing protein YqiC